MRRLRTACERAKRTLSGGTQATVEIDSLFDGEDFSANITRARFEDLNQKAFSGTMIPVQKVLDDAGLDKSKIDDIVLVGGSTRIPRIQKLLSDYFNGKKLEKSINPDEAVAYGAAVQAGVLSGKATSAETADLLLLDVVPLSLGVAMEGNIFAPVVPRGNTVPCLKKRTFTTVADNQQTVQFPVFQGERVNCEDNTSLGEFTLAPIPPMKAGDAVLEVVFEVDVNGILKVTATEKTSGRSANITISNSVGKLTSTEIENMINGMFHLSSWSEVYMLMLLFQTPRSSRTATMPSARNSKLGNNSNRISLVLKKLPPTPTCRSNSSVVRRRRSSLPLATPWLSSRLKIRRQRSSRRRNWH